MYPIYFTARLYSCDGILLEHGEACISKHECRVTFKNEFVPLIKLGTSARIVRVLGDTELECFEGTVYLSSRNLLQIIDVDAAVMNAARELFDINMYQTACFALSPDGQARFNPRKSELITGTIRYISENTIKISAIPFIGEGQVLMIDSELPLKLSRTVVRVQKRVLLGRKAAILLCKIIKMPVTEKLVYCNFLASIKKEEEQLEVDFEGNPPFDELTLHA